MPPERLANGTWVICRNTIPRRRGFDEYFGTLLGHADYYRHTYMDGTRELREGEQPVDVPGYLTDLLNQRAVKFIRQHVH